MANQQQHDAAITAIDAHAHVFERGLPLAARRRYAPDYDATLADYLATLDAHGISHGVLVQPSFLGTDCRYLLDALACAPGRLRGVAVIDPSCEPAIFEAMDRAGVVGIRLNLLQAPDPHFDDPAWRAALAQIARLGWHVELHVEAARLAGIARPLLNYDVRIVVDHFGRPEPSLGVGDPGFRDLLALGRTGRVWVKVSGVYRIGGLALARAATDALKAAFGMDRLVWGSDWPHTQFERAERFDDALRVLHTLIPDVHERHAVLANTPAQLFGFV
ncbi:MULTISPECIES: amidohydrolase family protein [unclassified Caballeronia]|uniref:amidohydrolase family protein n=1 Tax=unclassified Caballeronia TaxID=2646786 RepID=UPI002864FCF0|nr:MULTISPECIES: amidohydrolase family protein [unclassified Caballeronia]MDR5754545.1 amidohydrolase family protein [Caballeronia sp. LZ024]MDR5839516.1 amidohydrolase family protein [Caballeronia sp. LZ031]